MKQLIRMDKNWIPNVPGYSLYIRPTMSELLFECLRSPQ